MKLQQYLDRLGYRGSRSPTLETLTSLLTHHVLSIPFENLDVQLGVPLTTEVAAAFAKIVERKRGGWCYEQNGLFGWALCELGFDVTRVAAAVRRQERGSKALNNHLCLLVRVADAPRSVYLADVGFGGSMIKPMCLEVAQDQQTPFRVGLARLDDGYWRFCEQAGTDSVSFDFLAEPGDEAALSKKCEDLQTNPESSFVLSLVAQKRLPESHISLRGRVLTTTTRSGKESRVLSSADELEQTLKRVFQLDVPGGGKLWSKIVARHKVLFGA